MRVVRRSIGTLALAMGIGLGVATPSAPAQGYGGPGDLGGFGSSPGAAMSAMGAGSPMILPYGGTFEGFMPGRMGGGSALSFRTRPTAPLGARREPFRLSPLSGSMSGMSGGAFGVGRMGATGSRGTMGLGTGTNLGGMRRMPGPGGTSVMPPSIGYPFRQPPSLVSPASPGTGMSM